MKTIELVQNMVNKMGCSSNKVINSITKFIEENKFNENQIKLFLEAIESDYEEGGINTISREDMNEICDATYGLEMDFDEEEE